MSTTNHRIVTDMKRSFSDLHQEFRMQMGLSDHFGDRMSIVHSVPGDLRPVRNSFAFKIEGRGSDSSPMFFSARQCRKNLIDLRWHTEEPIRITKTWTQNHKSVEDTNRLCEIHSTWNGIELDHISEKSASYRREFSYSWIKERQEELFSDKNGMILLNGENCGGNDHSARSDVILMDGEWIVSMRDNSNAVVKINRTLLEVGLILSESVNWDIRI